MSNLKEIEFEVIRSGMQENGLHLPKQTIREAGSLKGLPIILGDLKRINYQVIGVVSESNLQYQEDETVVIVRGTLFQKYIKEDIQIDEYGITPEVSIINHFKETVYNMEYHGIILFKKEILSELKGD